MNYRNAKYINNTGWIDCEIEHDTYGWIPYTLNPDDTDTTVNNTVLLKYMATNNNVAPHVPPTKKELSETLAAEVRFERDSKLIEEVDPIAGNALRWADLTTEEQRAWSTYRLMLLDVPSQGGFPHDVVWPTKPE